MLAGLAAREDAGDHAGSRGAVDGGEVTIREEAGETTTLRELAASLEAEAAAKKKSKRNRRARRTATGAGGFPCPRLRRRPRRCTPRTQARMPATSSVRARDVRARSSWHGAEQVVDTTGAGDSFIGSFCFGVATDGRRPPVRLGAYVAARKCTVLGARRGSPGERHRAGRALRGSSSRASGARAGVVRGRGEKKKNRALLHRFLFFLASSFAPFFCATALGLMAFGGDAHDLPAVPV